MKMKRIIAGVLAASMLLMFTACGKRTGSDDSNTSSLTNERILYPEDDTATDTEETDETDETDSNENGSALIESRKENSGESKKEKDKESSSSKVLIQKERTSSAKPKTTSVTSKKTSTSKSDTDTAKTSSKETSSAVSSSVSSSASSSASSSKDMSSMASSSKPESDVSVSTDTQTDTDTESDTDTDTVFESDTDTEPEKILVVYFSRAGEQYNGVIEEGNTAIVANIIANYLGAESKEITPLDDQYPTTYQELLDYTKEEKSNSARPAIAEDFSIINEYDTIFVGYPVWHSDLPMIMYTFFESYDFTGKKVIPFCTYGGSGDAGTFDMVKALTGDAEHADGFASLGELSQTDRHGVRDNVIVWLEGLGYGV